jgi:hypothetical protein
MSGLQRKLGFDPMQEAEKLRAEGWHVYTFPPGISDKARFFESVKAILPLDPPIVGINLVWDALCDSMWEGLFQLQEKRIAIVWPIADLEGCDDMKVALDLLEELTISLADPRLTGQNPKSVLVLLV